MSNSSTATPRRKSRTLTLELVDSIADRIRGGLIAPGERLPTEAEAMREFGVSRTVVREAISRLQAAGLVETRHGVGSFAAALGEAASFRIAPDQYATLRDVIAVLELRIGIETEAAALAAQRRSSSDLDALRAALDAFAAAIEQGSDAVAVDFDFHLGIARATQNGHFVQLMSTLGTMIIPRARLAAEPELSAERRDYLLGVNREHESIVNAIYHRDSEGARAAMRTHLANSRERRRRDAGAD